MESKADRSWVPVAWQTRLTLVWKPLRRTWAPALRVSSILRQESYRTHRKSRSAPQRGWAGGTNGVVPLAHCAHGRAPRFTRGQSRGKVSWT
eukprot:7556015-Pyramimonas_sp.AAC.1